MYCKDCLKCVILKQSDDKFIYYCEVIKIQIKDNIKECNRFSARNRLNKFSEEHNS